MSIIERVINALGKGEVHDREKAAEAGIDRRPLAAEAVNTVQRAEANNTTHSKPAVAHSRDEQAAPSPLAHGQDEQVVPSPAAHFPDEQVVPKITSVPRVGTGDMVKIPFSELRELGILTPDIPRSVIAEEYRIIKRPLLVNITGDSVTSPIPHGNLIMVTSALEGDGKTFSAICLALSISMEPDKHVLFVDADTAKAEAGRLLGVAPTNPGLIDLLENKSSCAADFILPTNVEKLRILPAGGVHTHANELLASARMHQLMLELSDEDPNQVIIFDSPPLLLTTEAAVLAGFMGQIVFVVSAEMTPQHAVTQAIEHIGEEKMVGMVLNRSRRRMNPYYHAYGYGGGTYGHGHRDKQPVQESGQ